MHGYPVKYCYDGNQYRGISQQRNRSSHAGTDLPPRLAQRSRVRGNYSNNTRPKVDVIHTQCNMNELRGKQSGRGRRQVR